MLQDYPRRVNNGVKFLQRNGFSVEFAENARKQLNYISASISDRIDDIHNACKNSETNVIMSAIGGYNANQLLDGLDFELIGNSNKIFVGYSDITALLVPIYAKTGIEVLHGISFLSEVCEYPCPYEYSWNSFLEAYKGMNVKWEPPYKSTNEFYDWAIQEKEMYERKLNADIGWDIIREGECEGILFGGNLSTIMNLISTDYLHINIFEGKILFIEEINCSLAELDALMYSMKQRGIFDRIAGLVIGKPDNEFKSEGSRDLKSVVLEVTTKRQFPIISNVDLGHTDPMITIPIGRSGYLSCNSQNGILFGCNARNHKKLQL